MVDVTLIIERWNIVFSLSSSRFLAYGWPRASPACPCSFLNFDFKALGCFA